MKIGIVSDEKMLEFLRIVIKGPTMKIVDSLSNSYKDFGSLTTKQQDLLMSLYERNKNKSPNNTTLIEPETRSFLDSKCKDCGDSGNLFTRKRGGAHKDYSSVFRCHCEKGEARPISQGAQWDDSYESEWVKESLRQ